MYNEHEREFEFAQELVFSNAAADEINRAPPKTQSALLESMEDRQVSVDGTTHRRSQSVSGSAAADQSVYEGTFQIPGTTIQTVGQRDRSRWLPDVEVEMRLLDGGPHRRHSRVGRPE